MRSRSGTVLRYEQELLGACLDWPLAMTIANTEGLEPYHFTSHLATLHGPFFHMLRQMYNRGVLPRPDAAGFIFDLMEQAHWPPTWDGAQRLGFIDSLWCPSGNLSIYVRRLCRGLRAEYKYTETGKRQLGPFKTLSL